MKKILIALLILGLLLMGCTQINSGNNNPSGSGNPNTPDSTTIPQPPPQNEGDGNAPPNLPF
ncbi:MAG: hypothetical protein V1777_01440 [Candidatus Micrarchaeota archaeon]